MNLVQMRSTSETQDDSEFDVFPDGTEGQDWETFRDEQDEDGYDFDDESDEDEAADDDEEFDDDEGEPFSQRERAEKIEITESEESRFAQAWEGSREDWVLPADIGINLTWQSKIPGCEGGNVCVRVQAIEYNGRLLVDQGGSWGLKSSWTFYVIDERESFQGPVFQRWHDEVAIERGTRTRGNKTGALVRWKGREMVVVGLIQMTYSLPTTEGAASLEEAKAYGLGSGLSQDKANGAQITYRQAGAFPIMTVEYSDGSKWIATFIKLASRKWGQVDRLPITEADVVELEKKPLVTSQGQFCLF